MCWGYRSKARALMKGIHNKYGVWDLMVNKKAVGDANLDLKELLRSHEYEQHGWFMWGAWYVVALLLLITKRYTKTTWNLNHYLHALLGYFSLVVTIVFALKVTDWNPVGLHEILGTAFLFIAIVGTLSGSVTAGTMRLYNGDKDWAKQERVTQIAKIHRYAGYFMLLLGSITVSTGIFNYFEFMLLQDSRKLLAQVNIVSFVALVIIFETIYRLRNNYSRGKIDTPKV